MPPYHRQQRIFYKKSFVSVFILLLSLSFCNKFRKNSLFCTQRKKTPVVSSAPSFIFCAIRCHSAVQCHLSSARGHSLSEKPGELSVTQQFSMVLRYLFVINGGTLYLFRNDQYLFSKYWMRKQRMPLIRITASFPNNP